MIKKPLSSKKGIPVLLLEYTSDEVSVVFQEEIPKVTEGIK